MISRLLLCVCLGYSMTGGYADIQKDYKGEECNTRLDLGEYYDYLQDIEIPSKKNGNPHYIWGTLLKTDVVLFCARVTARDNITEVTQSVKIPENIFEDSIRAIEVIDLTAPAKGGNVKINGKYRPSFYVDFENIEGKKMDYVLTIFGKKDSKIC